MKLNYRKTMLIGFGFLASSLAWAMYNANVPLILGDMTAHMENNMVLVGFIMTIDNIFGVIFQPLFGALSDRTRTRFGRRMPYIIIGLPICAVAFVLIPQMSTLWALMAVLIVFNLVMSFWRSPVITLMPDLTPPELRSKANGVINFMGGIGSLIAFFGGSFLLKWGGNSLTFGVGAAIMIASLILLVIFVREPKVAYAADVEPDRKKEKVILSKPEKKSLILILVAIFFWFVGYNGIETFFTTYAVNSLGIDESAANMMLSFYSVAFLAAAIPAGLLGSKIGRRKCIMLGLGAIMVLFIPMYFVTDLWTVRILMLLGGASWALVNINSLPMVVQLAGEGRLGTFTGYYYFFSFSAAIVSPPLVGLIFDAVEKSHYNLLFIYAPVAFAIALFAMSRVKHGEAPAKEKA